jgi:prolipoprotein diacylglyceryl transferase
MIWNPSPEIFSVSVFGLFDLSPRWYGALFALGFAAAYGVMTWVIKRESKPRAMLDDLLIYVMVGTIAGARLGHCLFYEPARYLSNPIEILFVWQGGLASHGAAIGIIFSCWLFSRRKKKSPSFWWILDRVSLTVPLAGGLVRLGNFMNSEILGKPTGSDWGVIFSRIDQVPRHPAQLYEAISYFLIFGILWFYYKRRGASTPPAAIFGSMMAMIFTARFVIEFWKEYQVAFEAQLPLSMGQLLSLPLIAIGIYLFATSGRRAKN